MFCSNCGNRVKEDDKFCENCGSPLIPEAAGKPAEPEYTDSTVCPENGTDSEADRSPDSPDAADSTVQLDDTMKLDETIKLDTTIKLDMPQEQNNTEEGDFPNLEKKIMQNMEDELIFDIPEKGEAPAYEPVKVRREAKEGQKKPGSGKARKGSGKQDLKKKKKSKKKWIILSAAAVAVIAVAAVVMLVITGPVNRLRSSVGDRDWQEARQIYENSFLGREGREARADDIFAAAVEEIESEFAAETMDYQTAFGHLSALAAFWDDSRARSALDSVEALNSSRNAFQRAESCMESGDYAQAVESYGQVIESDSRYSEAQSRLETARSRYKQQIFTESDELEEQNEYQSAILLVEDALELLGEDADLRARLTELEDGQSRYQVQSVLDQAQVYADRGNYYSAMDLVGNALKTNRNNESLQSASEEYRQKYEEDILANAEAALGNDENYEAAIIVLDNALRTLGGEYPEIEQALQTQKEVYVQAQLSQSAEDGQRIALIGVWRTDSMFFWEKERRLEVYDNGRFHMDAAGTLVDGTWEPDSQNENTYLLESGGQTYRAVLEDDGMLSMEYDGSKLQFSKEQDA